MYILGLSFHYHDGSAALVKDGTLVAAGEEERFSRRKHDPGFPGKAIQFCLEHEGITIDDVDYVVFYEKPFIKFERLLVTALQTFPKSLRVFRESMLAWMQKKLWVKSMILEELGIPKKKLLFADHHMSHAAASFFSSPFEEAAVLTLDGAGEWTTSTMGKGSGTKIEILKEMRFPHSVGLLYSAFTAYCGFEVNEGEYKLMGMAPYGEPKYVDRIMKMIKIGDDGSLWQDMQYFAYHWSATHSYTTAFEEVMGRPGRDPALEDKSLDPFYCDVAMSIQKVTEDIMKRMVNHVVEITGCTNVCLAGGVALNSVANGKLVKETAAEQVYVHPAAGDDGGAAGAALWACHHILDVPRAPALDHAYLGSEYSDEQIEAFLGEHAISYEKIEDDEEFFDRVTDDLIAGKVGGWYRGRFEWGPRALGARSIIADARSTEMKEIVNAKIKFREAFRPFAPSVLEERAREYFELPEHDELWAARFMLYVVPVKDEKRDEIPAITHVDGSGRLQTVVKSTNPDYHRMIERFAEKTGVPVVLNTSFNLKGEPIVETPAQAFNTFSRSEMDVLYLRNFVITKEAKKIIDSTPFMLRHEGDRVAEMVELSTLDIVFVTLWVLFTLLYWSTYRKTENLLAVAGKVACLLGFVYLVIRGFDWLAAPVPPEDVITFGIGEAPTTTGPRVPLLADGIFYFAGLVVVLIIWHARKKFDTVAGVVLSAWDRGHWYMLPVLFILMTVGLLLVAAAASPVLSPFIYTLF